MKRHILRSLSKFQAISYLHKIFFTLAILVSSTTQAQVDPATQWKMIETDHSIWVFDAKHQKLAHHYLSLFERAQPKVLKLFGEAPRKTTFVLLDNTDIANGSARVVPSPLVNLLPVLPTPQSSIGEFSDSAFELTAHEYTHILNMEPVHGLMTPLKWIFGSIARPNMMLPRWYTEGLAVFTESYLSPGGGRLNSQHLAGIVRSLTLENRWEDFPLSQINEGKPDWLGGSRPYIFGGLLWQNMAKEKGLQRIAHNNVEHSRRLPYFLGGVENYGAELGRAYDKWKSRAEKQIAEIKNKPHIPGRKLFQKGFSSFYPSISPNGRWLAYINNSDVSSGDIYTVRRHKKKGFRGYKPKKVLTASQVQTLTWHPKSSGFVYEKADVFKGFYRFYDLYFYNRKKKTSKRLTTGQRTTHPCFSPSGKSLYFIQNTPGGRQIVHMDWKSRKLKTIYQPPIGTQLMYLGCPKEQLLTFSEQRAGESSALISLNVQTKQTQKYLEAYKPRYSKWTKKGLIFSSSRSGVENLYLAENFLEGATSIRAITNTMTRINYGDMSPLDSNLYFSQYTADGPKLFQMKGAQWESLSDEPPIVSPLVELKEETRTPSNTSPTESTSHTEEDFSPWGYMLPNHWIPFLFLVDQGMIFQATTSASDPLGINSYSLAGQYDTLTKEPGVSFSYFNRSWPINLGFGLSDVYSFYYPTEQKLRFRNASLNSSWRIFSWSNNLRFSLNWNYSSLSAPTSIGTVELIRQGPSARISYADISQRGKQISPESGWTFSLSHRNFLADAGNRSYEQTRLHLGTHWSYLFPRRHSLYLGINGSYAPKLRQNTSFFWTTTLSGPFQNTQFATDTLMQRGYASGTFLGWNMLNVNTEYRFPLWYTYRGLTSPPFFIRRLYAHLVFDATSLDGRRPNLETLQSEFSEFGTWFTGYGIEFHAETSIGFHLPVTFTLGFYQGQNKKVGGDLTTFFNLRF